MELKDLHNMVIEWDLAPADAVTLYLEWGNNDWHAEHAPVRSKADFANYFVVDNWEEHPTVRLVRRNSENAEDLMTLSLPQELEEQFLAEYGGLKGVHEPTPAIKQWLKEQIYGR
ncbi:MAG: hypothetical protein J5855_07210 [Mailhella sp.]|nr:hypothetical protein [Mailhella sp.]